MEQSVNMPDLWLQRAEEYAAKGENTPMERCVKGAKRVTHWGIAAYIPRTKAFRERAAFNNRVAGILAKGYANSARRSLRGVDYWLGKGDIGSALVPLSNAKWLAKKTSVDLSAEIKAAEERINQALLSQ